MCYPYIPPRKLNNAKIKYSRDTSLPPTTEKLLKGFRACFASEAAPFEESASRKDQMCNRLEQHPGIRGEGIFLLLQEEKLY